MVWNVYIYDYTSDSIVPYNIFEHSGFRHNIKEASKRSNSKSEFRRELEHNLRYYFWSKYEYEVIIAEYTIGDGVVKKIDVFSQVMLNWNVFVDYVWNNRKLLKEN